MKLARQDNIPFLQFESWPNGRLQHAVFTRQGGVSPAPFHSLNLSLSVADSEANVYANRAKVYGLYGRSSQTVVHAHLVHGHDVARVTAQEYGTWVPRVDGLITNEPACALVMNYADCTPIFLFDPVHQAVGLGHAGWQGTVQDLPGALVRAMQAAFGTDPTTLLAGIGPCIGPCCYEVGEPVITAVTQAFPHHPSLLIHQGEGQRPHFNLPLANQINLQQAGVHHIESAALCTACHTDLFFSHRAEKGRTGRFGSILFLS